MKHLASPAFWRCFENLSSSVQSVAREQFKRMKENDRHPSLHLKKVGHYWSVRIGLAHRALAIEENGTRVWFWIGNHADYDRLIAKQ